MQLRVLQHLESLQIILYRRQVQQRHLLQQQRRRLRRQHLRPVPTQIPAHLLLVMWPRHRHCNKNYPLTMNRTLPPSMHLPNTNNNNNNRFRYPQVVVVVCYLEGHYLRWVVLMVMAAYTMVDLPLPVEPLVQEVLQLLLHIRHLGHLHQLLRIVNLPWDHHIQRITLPV